MKSKRPTEMSESCSFSEEILTDDQIQVSQVAQTLSSQNVKLKKQLNELQRRYSDLQELHRQETTRLEATISDLNEKCQEQNVLAQQAVDSCGSQISSSKVEMLAMQTRLEQAESELKSLLKAVTSKTGVRTNNTDDAIIALSNSGNEIFGEISRKYSMKIGSLGELYEFINGIMKIPTTRESLDGKDYKILYEQSELENQRLREQQFIPKPVERSERGRILELEAENQRLRNLLEAQKEEAELREVEVPEQPVKEEVNLDYELRIADYETKIRELELELDEAHKKQAEVVSEHASYSESRSEIVLEDDTVERATTALIECTESQSETIDILAEQKKSMNSIIGTLLKGIEAAEYIISDITEERDGIAEELSRRTSEFQQVGEKNAELLEGLLGDIIDILPEDANTNEEASPREQIMQIVTSLVENGNKDVVAKDVKPEKNKEVLLLSLLENALSFVRFFATSKQDSGEPVLDEAEKTRIMNEVTRIDKIIATECIDLPHVKSPSLFTEESPDEQLGVVLEMMGGKITQSPFRELYDLFAGIIDVNALLYMRNRDLIDQMTVGSRRRIQDLTEVCERQKEQLDSVAETLRGITKAQEGDALVLANDVVNEFNQLVADNEANIEAVKSLNKKKLLIEEQQMQMAAKKDHKRIETLKDHVKILTRELERERNDRNEMVTRAHKQLDEAIAALAEAEETKTTLAACEAKIEKLKASKERLAQVEAQLAAFDQERSALDIELSILRGENERLAEQNAAFSDTISNLKTVMHEQADKYAALKVENNNLKKQNTVTLQDIRDRNALLQEKYEKRLVDLEETVTSKNNDLSHALADKNKLKAIVAENKLTIAKLKLAEKTLTVKLTQATEQSRVKLETLESQYNASITALKAELETEIRNLTDEINNGLDSLISSVESTFGITLNSRSKKSLANFAYTFAILLQENSIMDTLAMRKELKLRDGDSLNSVFTSLKQQIGDRDKTTASLKEEISALAQQTEVLKLKCKEMEGSHRKNSEWEKWGRNMMLVATDYIPPTTPEDTRFILEEAIMASLGSKTLRKRLEILRNTKKFLTSSNAAAVHTRSSNKEPTIRALTLVFLCANRLRKARGPI